MWQCVKCGETIEDTFEVCWNCGTSEEGIEDPTFYSRNALGATSEPEQSVDQACAPVYKFRCAKCSGNQMSAKRIATTGIGFSRIFDIQNNIFVAVSCTRCGFTELYDPEILERSSDGKNMLDLWFGD